MTLLVLWDIDQTLIDMGELDREIWFTLCGELLGVPPREAEVVPGSTVRALLRSILEQYGADAVTADALLPNALARELEMLRQCRDVLTTRGRVMPGARELVRALVDVPGVVQSVLTGNQKEGARLKLEAFGLDDILDLDVGAYGSDSESRPELIPIARSRASAIHGTISTDEIVLVGDSRLDIDAARRNGVRVVAVASGVTPFAQLEAAGADDVLGDLRGTRAGLSAVLGTEPAWVSCQAEP